MTKRYLGYLFVAIGIVSFCYSLYLLKLRNSPVTSLPVQNISTGENLPVRIILPTLNLDLPIASVHLTENKWPAGKDSVSYWIDSPIPGENGNSVIYGHNWPNLFGRLKNIKLNDTINIQFSNSSTKAFKVVETYTVTPDQTHIVEPTDDQRVTIYTCTGFLDSKRFVVIAVPSDTLNK